MKLIHVSGVDKKPQRLHSKLVTKNTTCISNRHQDHHFTTAEIADVPIKGKKQLHCNIYYSSFQMLCSSFQGTILVKIKGRVGFGTSTFQSSHCSLLKTRVLRLFLKEGTVTEMPS